MPELPEVESVRRSLERHVVGRRIEAVTVRDARLRARVERVALTRLAAGRDVVRVRRRAKYLLLDLAGDAVVLIHLGMTGTLRLVDAAAPFERHDHVVFSLAGGRELRFNDPRRFGLVAAFTAAAEAGQPALRGLGVEPLGDGFSGEELYRATRRRKRAVKSFIMDAAHVVGVGNIYAAEALYRAGLHPAAPAGSLSRARVERLARAIRATLRDAIDKGGTTLRDFSNTGGEAGAFAARLRVYGREGGACRRCRGVIRRMVQSGRSTFYCPRCQRR